MCGIYLDIIINRNNLVNVIPELLWHSLRLFMENYINSGSVIFLPLRNKVNGLEKTRGKNCWLY